VGLRGKLEVEDGAVEGAKGMDLGRRGFGFGREEASLSGGGEEGPDPVR